MIEQHLFILVGGHCNELCLRESVSPEGAAWNLHRVVSSYDVKPWLVLVH